MLNNPNIKQENSPSSAGSGQDGVAPPCPPDKPIVTESSWGDRWKKAGFGVTVHFGVNYVINTLFSVALAYVFERKFDTKLQNFSQKVGLQVAKFTGCCEKQAARNFYMGTKGLSLTTGGTILVPVVKTAIDHQHRMEFKIGHGLDVMQNALGLGNAATEENLREYKVIKAAVKSGKTPDACAEDLERFKSQHHVDVLDNGKFGFTEHKLSWSKAIIARAAAWVAAFGTNSGLEHTVGLKKMLSNAAPGLTAKISNTIPAYKRLADPDLFSRDIMNDAILTVSSSITNSVVLRAIGHEKTVPRKHAVHAAKQWAQNAPVPAGAYTTRVDQDKTANDTSLARA